MNQGTNLVGQVVKFNIGSRSRDLVAVMTGGAHCDALGVGGGGV
jgi:hypothetical protein